MNRDDLELYVMGMYDGDVAALERELAEDAGARATVADEARLELLLRDAAAAATFCPACDDLVAGARCNACGAALRPGGYTVERVLVSNAHGRMYAARDVDGKQVALKELVFVQSPTVEALAAFEREARFLRALEHPAIPRFCASFQEEAGVHTRYYLAQDLVTGEALDRRLEDHFFSEAEILDIARQVLDVLVYLQGLSPMVIHRDIKPANLVVRPDGTIAVVDFGAAHVQGMTVGSTAIGTFGYMPLEQLAGEVDATTDVYALGASLLHLLTRREPWRLLQSGLLADAEPNVGRRTRAFLAKLVAPNPRDRFRCAGEALAALDRLEHRKPSPRALRPAPAAAAPTSLVAAATAAKKSASRWRWPRRFAFAAAAAVVLVVGAGGIAALMEPDSNEQRMAEAQIAADRAQEAAERARRQIDEGRRTLDKLRKLEDQMRGLSRLQRALPQLAQVAPRDGAERSDGIDAVAQLDALTAEMCRCSDQRCADAAGERLDRWGRDLAPRVPWGKPAVMKQIAELSQRNLACLARLVGGAAPPGDSDVEALAVPPGKPVWLLDPGASAGVHDAVQAIAQSCHVDVVMAARITGALPAKPPVVRCDHPFDALAQAAHLEVEDRGGVFRIERPAELAAERRARDRGEHPSGGDPLPHGQDVALDFKLAPLRDVLGMLAHAGGVELVLPEVLNSKVTLRATDRPWQRMLVEVLAASGLGYRYDASSRRLTIWPLDMLTPGRSAP